MPNIKLPIPGVNMSVTRPVVLEVVRELLEYTDLPKNMPIVYPGNLEKVQQVGSTLDAVPEPNLFPFSERFMIEVDEDHDPDRLLSVAVDRPENRFIFLDQRLDTWIKPVYSPQAVTINFRYRAESETQAVRWRDQMRAKFSQMRDILMHTASYNFMVPMEYIAIMKEIHRLREAVAGYGEDWETYFKANLTQRASIATTMAGTMPAWVIADRQLRIAGAFDFEGVPEKGNRDGEGAAWTISFSYKFMYDKPVECIMRYPLMIHNQVIGPKYRPDKPQDRIEFHTRNYALSAACFLPFESGQLDLTPTAGYAIPAIDEFVPESVMTGTQRLFTALLSLNTDPKDDPLHLLKLTETPPIVLDPTIVDFMKGEIPFMCKPYQSIFQLSLYQGAQLMSPESLMIESDYNVYSTTQLDPRTTYHLRLGIVEDLTLLSQAALDRLRRNAPALQVILDTLRYPGEPPETLDGFFIPKKNMQDLLDVWNKVDLNSTFGNTKRFTTVCTMFIDTERAS